MVPPEEITKKVNEVIVKYVHTSAVNFNKLIEESSVNRPNASKCNCNSRSRKTINGSGLKVTYKFFLLLLKIMADILKFTDTPIIDENIEEYEYHEYEPITGTSPNNGVDIRIRIESQDVFTHPSESYSIFEGRLTKVDGTLYVNADEVALTKNAIMHLFSRIEYHLSNQLIKSFNYPGQETTMIGLLKYPDDFQRLRV